MLRRTLLRLAAAAAVSLAGGDPRTPVRTSGASRLPPAVRPVVTGARPVPDARIRRTALFTRSEPGIRIHVHELTTPYARRTPVLLVHGARPDGLAAFDLPVAGGSFAADLVRAGHPAYVMDVRGFGASTYPAAMSHDPERSDPLVRSHQAVRDVAAAVDLVRRRHPHGRLAAFGWATGGHWLGMYAAQRPDRIADLVILNSLYSGTSPWPLQSELEDPDNPGEPLPQPGWRAVSAESLTARWDVEGNPDPVIRKAYREQALSADPTSHTRVPPSFRNPTGPLIDAFYLAQGRQFWDASLIRSRTLVVRSERDFWSRVEDADRLAAHLTSAREVRSTTLPNASHYVHLEPEYGRDRLLSEVLEFLR